MTNPCHLTFPILLFVTSSENILFCFKRKLSLLSCIEIPSLCKWTRQPNPLRSRVQGKTNLCPRTQVRIQKSVINMIKKLLTWLYVWFLLDYLAKKLMLQTVAFYDAESLCVAKNLEYIQIHG